MNSDRQTASTAPGAPALGPARAPAGDDRPDASDAPYAIAQATPTCTDAALKPLGTLPPIATARPLGHISEIQSHLPGGSNIPLNNESAASVHGGGGGGGNDLRYVTVMTIAPSAVLHGADADLDDSRFEFLQRTRWVAAAMLAYYLATFFFVQPFLIGALGVATGFIGYLSARPPVDFRRIQWLRWYVWLNYAMLGLNAWLLVVAMIALSMDASADDADSADIDDSGDSDAASGSSWMADADFSPYYSTSLGVYVGVIVGLNMVMHLRGLRTAKLLLAELVAVGLAPIVLAASVV